MSGMPVSTSPSRKQTPLHRVPARRRSGPRHRAARLLACALIGLGALALLDVGITLVWQEPFTALYAKFRQDHLAHALRAIERAAPTAVERRALANLPNERRRIAFLAGQLEHHAANGSAVGRIMIPRIGASFVIVKGVGTEELKGGPGIYPETSFPGIPGTTAIAGHRTTYLAPFRHIDSLRSGNRILLYMPYAHFTYTVIGREVVVPTDVPAAVNEVGYSRLVLSACTPLFSAAKRLLVFAHLTRTVPVGAARRLGAGVMPAPIESPGPLRRRVKVSSQFLPPVLESSQRQLLTPLV